MVSERADAQRSVKSADRVLDILEYVRALPEGATFARLGADLGIPKSSLHALLDVMASRGWLDLDPSTRRYRLGLRVWEAGQAFPRHHGILEVAGRVLARMVAEVNETAQLARLSGSENVYLAKVDSSHALRLQSETGSRLSAHATGVGKALLAQLPDAEVARRFGGPALPAYTPNTLATLPALLAELAETRRRGFAIDNEEYTPGVFCLAVPILDQTGQASLAISVSVPVTRAAPEPLGRILATLAQGSIAVSQGIGVEPAPMMTALAEPAAAARAIAALAASGRYDLAFAR